jgi:acyl dehydratase
MHPSPVDITDVDDQDPFMFSSNDPLPVHLDLLAAAKGTHFGTILADPPWQFQNRTG